jgi:hypothetical protein|tara:strand:+ start:275 stop:541 length:267 start_codon:yes stop_codon:yes gene_type:complete
MEIIMSSNLINALAKRYEADILNAKANIEVYIKNPAGIGEHPDLAGAIDSQVDVIASAEDKLGVINKHYSDKPEMLIENEDAQLVLNI